MTEQDKIKEEKRKELFREMEEGGLLEKYDYNKVSNNYKLTPKGKEFLIKKLGLPDDDD